MRIYMWTYEGPDYCSIDDIIRLNVLVVADSDDNAWDKVKEFAERKCYRGCYNVDGELSLLFDTGEITDII